MGFNRKLILANLSVLLSVTLSGCMFVAAKFLLSEILPSTLVLLRFWIAALVFALCIPLLRPNIRQVTRSDLLLIASAAVMGVVIPGTAVTYGQQYVTAGMASLIVCTNPIHTALLSAALMGERMGPRKIAGMFIAGAGIVVVIGWGWPGAQIASTNLVGVLVMLAGPLSWAGFTLVGKSLMRRHSPVHLTMYVVIVGAALLSPLSALGLAEQVGRLSSTGWLVLFLGGAFSTSVAFMLWYNGVKNLAPTQVAVYGNFTPVVSVLGGYALLGEQVTLFLAVGGALVVAGVALVNTGRPRPSRRAEAVPAAVDAEDMVVAGAGARDTT
ncbi:MAG: DMT family transporter [Chloroflexi bacterium]|nr:DMT family transporter [Chloroflexota bacterium]